MMLVMIIIEISFDSRNNSNIYVIDDNDNDSIIFDNGDGCNIYENVIMMITAIYMTKMMIIKAAMINIIKR